MRRADGAAAPVFIHPGFPKTATSTLQRHVFMRHPQLAYLGLKADDTALRHDMWDLCNADSAFLELDRLAQRMRARLPGDGRATVLSYENLALYESKDKGLIARRLHAMFPEAKLLFTLRRQEDLVVSWYLQKLPEMVEDRTFLTLTKWVRIGLSKTNNAIFDDLRYFEIIEYYASLFGRDRIRLFLFEDMLRDKRRYTADMAAFLGVDGATFLDLFQAAHSNRRITQAQLDFWSAWSRLLRPNVRRRLSKLLRIDRGAPARPELDQDTRAAVARMVARGNREIERLYGVDLAGHGYTVAARASASDAARVTVDAGA